MLAEIMNMSIVSSRYEQTLPQAMKHTVSGDLPFPPSLSPSFPPSAGTEEARGEHGYVCGVFQI